MKRTNVSTRIVLVVLIGLLALPLAQIASPVEARNKKRPRTVTITRTFSNPAAIDLPLAAGSPVSATLYPSAIEVSGVRGPIRDVNVRLITVSHAFGGSLQVLLEGPGGQTAIVMAHVAESSAVSNLTLRLDDEAAAPLTAPLRSGAFRPTNTLGTAVAFNTPAPATSASAALSVFDGGDPNGAWRLFVQDSFGAAETGVLAGGWELEIATQVKAKKKR